MNQFDVSWSGPVKSYMSNTSQGVRSVGSFLGRMVSLSLTTTEPDWPLSESGAHVGMAKESETRSSSSISVVQGNFAEACITQTNSVSHPKSKELVQAKVDACWMPSFFKGKQFIKQDPEFTQHFPELAKVKYSDSYVIPVYIEGNNDLDLPQYNRNKRGAIYLLPSHLFKEVEGNQVTFSFKGREYKLEMTAGTGEFIELLENKPLEDSRPYNIPTHDFEIFVPGISLPKQYSDDCRVYHFSEKGCDELKGDERQEAIGQAEAVANTPLAKLSFKKFVRARYNRSEGKWVSDSRKQPEVMAQRCDARSFQCGVLKDGKGVGIQFMRDPRFDTREFSILIEGDDLLFFSKDCSRWFLNGYDAEELKQQGTLKEVPCVAKVPMPADVISRLSLSELKVEHFGGPFTEITCLNSHLSPEGEIISPEPKMQYSGEFMITIPFAEGNDGSAI